MDYLRVSACVIISAIAVTCGGKHENPIISTETGRLQGSVQYARNSRKPVFTFLGVPYAAPPIGRFRFLPPQPLRAWEGVRPALKFESHCPQSTKDADRVYPYTPLPHHRTSEDCLHLNVYTSTLSGKQPVLLWIHGGSNECGSGSQYDGTVLASRQDVVVVTINYRLGALGWLTTLDDNMPGNAGLWDQRAAMQWVQQNIAQFGGDPRQVTIAGQSAGGMGVSVHVTSGASTGLFRRAISLSGAAMMLPNLHMDPLHATQLLAEKLACMSPRITDMVMCLRSKEADAIVSACADLSLLYHTVIDGDMLSALPTVLYKRKDHHLVDYMVGMDNDEGYVLTTLFGNLSRYVVDDASVKAHVQALLRYYMEGETQLLAQTIMDLYMGFEKNQSEQGLLRKASLLTGHMINSAPIVRAAQLHSANVRNTYMFLFHHRPSFSEKPTWVVSDHGDELPFLFGSMFSERTSSKRHYSNDDVIVSEMLMSYVAHFVKTGDPNNESMPLWPPFTPDEERYLNLSAKPSTESKYQHELMNFWNTKFTSFISEPIDMLHDEL